MVEALGLGAAQGPAERRTHVPPPKQ
jgi:hypothetical protein